MIALMITLSRAVRSGLNPTPSSMNGDSRPLIVSLAPVDLVDAGEAFEQGALAAAVAPDDPEELSGGDLDADVLDGAQELERARPERMQRALLERVVLLVGQAERLANVADRDRGTAPSPVGRARSARGFSLDIALTRQTVATGTPRLVLASAALNVCTIIAKNYVAYARVLATSFTEQHPDSRLWALIIDDFAAVHRSGRRAVRRPDAGVTSAASRSRTWRCAIRCLELSTAVKPWLMRHLMGETGGPVTYLDPDIKVYGSLQRLDELAAEHGVVLIPHNNEPIPPDGRKPSQVDIMIAGVYNLGYSHSAPRPEVDELIDWWADRLRRDCRVDPTWGYFVDQRWFDLAPGFLDRPRDRSRPRVQRRVLEPPRPEARTRRRALAGQRPAARVLSLQRLRSRPSAGAQPLPGPNRRRGDPTLERMLAEYAIEVNREGHAEAGSGPTATERLATGRGSTTRCARRLVPCTRPLPTSSVNL